jgi:hypothetical protein
MLHEDKTSPDKRRNFAAYRRVMVMPLYDLVKVKVNLSLYLINQAPQHEDVSGSGGIAPSFLTSALG